MNDKPTEFLNDPWQLTTKEKKSRFLRAKEFIAACLTDGVLSVPMSKILLAGTMIGGVGVGVGAQQVLIEKEKMHNKTFQILEKTPSNTSSAGQKFPQKTSSSERKTSISKTTSQASNDNTIAKKKLPTPELNTLKHELDLRLKRGKGAYDLLSNAATITGGKWELTSQILYYLWKNGFPNYREEKILDDLLELMNDQTLRQQIILELDRFDGIEKSEPLEVALERKASVSDLKLRLISDCHRKFEREFSYAQELKGPRKQKKIEELYNLIKILDELEGEEVSGFSTQYRMRIQKIQ